MNSFPLEIIDHIIYFTVNKVSQLSLINKYFNYQVRRIRITSNNKYPYISGGNLLSLPNLTKLKFSYKFDKIDRKLAKCSKLTYLDVFANDGITNEDISRLTSLISLRPNDLITNISHLTNLTALNLDANCSITSISNLTALRHLVLDNNRHIEGDQLTSLINLKTLMLNKCRAVTDGHISDLTGLTHLDLSGNYRITNQGIFSLTNLVNLNVNSNISNVASLPNLTKLILLHNELLNDERISTLTNLEHLLMNSWITINGIKNLPQLKVIEFSNYHYHKFSDEDIRRLRRNIEIRRK